MRKFAILGASGFIGYRLTEYLLLNDLAVPRPVVRTFRSMARTARFDLDTRIADAKDAKALASAMKGCDAVFHCVLGNRDTILNSVKATYVACRQAGVQRLVYLSSAVVHGHNPPPGTDEDSPLVKNQTFDYNVSKVLAEKQLRSMMRDRAVECVILRPSIVFGPRSTYWTTQPAYDILAGSAYLVNGGRGICNTIFIDNLVEIMVLCATHPAAVGMTFLVKDAERITWLQFYTAIAEAIGADPSNIRSVCWPQRPEEAAWHARERLGNVALKIWRSRFFLAARDLVRSPATISMALPLRGWLESFEEVRSSQHSPPDEVELDPEIVGLQLCQYELPSRKLTVTLNYQPSVTFEAATLRTAAWLRFALGGTV